jgi:hypothetical protein
MIFEPVPRGLSVTSQSRSARLGVSLAIALVCGVAHGRAQQEPASAPPDPAATAAFAGTWDYNARESVNAANGRPEQGAPGAGRRNPATAGLPPPGAGGGTGTGGGGGGGTGGGGGGGRGGMGSGGMGPGGVGQRSGRQMAFVETREIVRDLMEVPEGLRVKVTADGVTITDDLDRERTYPTDNKMRKYQLGAAQYEARARWDGAVFKKEIEAVRGFKMFETYFLSDDGNRMFVIIRIGEQTKNAPVVGVNRVYDRERRQE